MSGKLTDCVPEFYDDRKECVAREKGKKYTLINASGHIVKSMKLDDCLSGKNKGRRCDYLMHIDNKALQRAIFIELKGGDVGRALTQLYSTIMYLKSEFRDHQIDARIVSSRDVPGFVNIPAYRTLAREVQPTGGNIMRGTNNTYTENC